MSHRTLAAALISSAAVLPLALPAIAQAAPLRTPIKAEARYSTPLDAATGERSVTTLDQRTPTATMRFDLSQADIINDLSLTLSADPLPGVDPSLPLTVQFNNGKPIPIKTRGRGFDATVSLDPARIRAHGNTLRFSHAVPCNATGGGYTLNLDESRIDLRARPKSRRLQLREVESRLSASAFAPDTVGLIATGSHATKLQALGAQAIGLRMKHVPDFALKASGSDFTLVMLPRAELYKYTSEADILSGTGPRIELSREHPTRLFLTGDTEAEVLQSVQAFAQHYLPRSRRSTTSPGEIRVQSPLDYTRTRVDGSVALDGLSVTSGALREYGFDVSDPSATGGQLILRLTRDDNTAAGARMKAVLNGVSLGEARLDNRRKTVAYDIRPGQLVGTGNRLTLSTLAAPGSDACSGIAPFIAVGEGSKLVLNADTPSSVTDLSRLAASGSVFAEEDGANTAVVLPNGARDFAASLRVTAQLARAHGRGWTQAQFVRGDMPATDAHILSIEPYAQLDATIASAAPRGLQAAWRGQPTDGDNRLAAIERFASLDGDEAVRLAARRLRASGEVGAGGVAAIYPGGSGQLFGVITNTPGRSFTGAIEPLASDAHWNGMSGGVARWNDRAVVMAQTALPAPGVVLAEPQRETAWSRFAALELDMPRFELPDMDMPKVDLTRAKSGVTSVWNRITTRDAVADEAEWGATFKTPTMETFPDVDAPAAVAPVAVKKTVSRPTMPKAEMKVPNIKLPKIKAPKMSKPRQTPKATAPVLAETSVPALRGSIDLGAERHLPKRKLRFDAASWQMKGGDMRRALASKLRSARSWINNLEVDSSRLRRSMANSTGIRAPKLPVFKLGGHVIPAAVWMLVLGFMLALMGLVGINASQRGSSR